MNDKRKKQVEAQLLRSISEMILYKKIKHPGVFTLLNIVHIQLSKDFSFAKIYVSSPLSIENTRSGVQALNHSRGYIQGVLGQSFHWRKFPKLQFYSDDSLEKSFFINQLTAKISEQIKKDESHLEDK